jgi:SRSO17 transposase
MQLEDLDGWADAFAAFHARFADLFPRSESRQQAAKYLQGLLAPLERKNTWQVAEAVGDAVPDRMQRLLYRVAWDADVARDRLQAYVVEHFGDAEAIGVVDETGFLKKGSGSVGVQRQYSGTAGKVENCQLATFLTYASPHGHTFLDRRLYLPESWASDAARRARAKVPKEVTFQTKAQQAAAMLTHAWQQGVPMRWVTGDEVYGGDPALRDTIHQSDRLYVLAVTSTTRVWTTRPEVVAPQKPVTGRPQTRPRLAADALPPVAVAELVSGWDSAQWERFAVLEGAKGPRVYDWGRQRIVEQRDGLPDRDGWLLARRSVSDASEVAYYVSNADEASTLQELARVAATRFTVEQCLEEAKGEVGLDQYEVRRYPSWYRHITLCLMAHAWLAVMRSTAEQQQKGGRNWQP